MKAQDLKNYTNEEVKALIIGNTKKTDIKDSTLMFGFAHIYDMVNSYNSTMAEQLQLWSTILEGVYGLEFEIVDAVVEKLGTLEFIIFCKTHYQSENEVKAYIDMYKDYRDYRIVKDGTIANGMEEIKKSILNLLNDFSSEQVAEIVQGFQGLMTKLNIEPKGGEEK